eukprot:snap_masked-scaffold638_size121162-processed-gene-0.15 protein:Tk11625 transcript:snap_masked-scaffold638_size121162-processed-gene-0.15-mRNA-1 annotation:"unknown"
MSSMTKRKHVAREVLEDFSLPSSGQSIVRVLGGRGNNLHEVEDAQGQKFLVSMPNKFRRSIWVKRGDFVVVETIEEGDKVKAEIAQVLYKETIRYFKQQNVWPAQFQATPDRSARASVEQASPDPEEREPEDAEAESSDNDDDLFVNTNRQPVLVSQDEASSDED